MDGIPTYRSVSYHRRMRRLSWCSVAALTLCGATGMGADDQDGQAANRIPILTVCDALRDPARYGGQVVIVVGRSIGTSEGSWLSENCGLKLNAEGRTYSATISTAYFVSDFAPVPKMSKSFKWDKSALQDALNRVKATTHLEPKEHWGAVYGRLETAPTHKIKLRDGSVATIVGYGHLNAAPAQL